MKVSEARAAVLAKLDGLSVEQLREPASSSGARPLYPAPQILKLIAERLPPDASAYIRGCNPLARASLEAAIDASLEKRLAALQRAGRRRGR